MKRTVYSFIIAAAIAVVPLCAQETSHITGQVGLGFTNGLGRTGTYLDYGWNLGAGIGYNFNQRIGLQLNGNYSQMGINSSTLSGIGVPGGDVSIFTATIDPILHLTPGRHADVYVTGGGGLFHRNQEFTAPSVATTLGFFPYFGFAPVAVPTTTILSSYSVNKPGIDAGVGVAFGTKWHGKIFAEAKYYRMFYNSDFHTDYLPVTFGYRW
jgi:hypothetical protein